MRIIFFVGFFIISLATSGPGLCQGIQGCYPPPSLPVNPCITNYAAPPVAQSVQVEVPVPCAPLSCVLLSCAPPCPPQPVHLRVDVVVRPEAPKSCIPQRFCCGNPPIFEPLFYQAAGLVQSLIAGPLAFGERLMGHPVPVRSPAPCSMPCWRTPATMCPPCFQPAGTQYVAPNPFLVPGAPPGPPAQGKAPTVCAPTTGWTRLPNGPFPR